MEIKTIRDRLDDAWRFDRDVNAALADGWRLVRRDVILPVQPNTGRTYFHTMLYAELVKLDPEPEPEAQPLDPFEALRAVREFCDSTVCDGCPLNDWCARHLPNNEGPADWGLPEEVQNDGE